MELGYGIGINRTFQGTSKDMSIFSHKLLDKIVGIVEDARIAIRRGALIKLFPF